MFTDVFKKYSDFGPVFLRFSLGIIFLVHGVGKLLNVGPAAGGIAGTAGFFASIGIPAALFFTWVVALVETFGGLFLLIGFWIRLSALLLAIDMLVAFLFVHVSNGFNAAKGGFEFVFILFFGLLALLVRGAGKKWAIDKD